MELLKTILYILLYPGLIYCVIGGLILSGIDRKLLARMQKRIGPPILQPFYDFFKLLGKETIVPRNAAKKAFLAAPVIGLISLITVSLFIPVFKFSPFSTYADLIVVIYLLTIPAVALIVGGSASGSPYAGVGISREMVAIISYELPMVVSLLAIAKKVGLALNNGVMTFSLAQIVEYQAQNGPLFTKISIIPAFIAMLLVIPCKVGSLPFDIAEAEIEICEGPLVEYSGAPLAIFKLNHAIKMLVMTSLFVTLFLSGAGTGVFAVDAVIQFILMIIVMFFSVTLLKAITARLRVEQTLKFYWTYPTALAFLSLILVYFGL
ncbi:MAG: carbon monoxide-induced hydrogenase subunit CooK [Caloramator sp.]|uniref:respiratory chain complex I subunit 1 family protein n=1 Tax=Caloramator sp. TaxID=1871330 RepID=UPI001D30C8D3|nr:complex I subunit 1 family protein [Caloramator sp.]MBZ4662339.1 carbon monoxide-induced hydrogenase subunit CooK [Caloramator sp.]